MMKRKKNERKMFFNYYRIIIIEVGWDYCVLIVIYLLWFYGDVMVKENLFVMYVVCIINCIRYCKKKILVIFF